MPIKPERRRGAPPPPPPVFVPRQEYNGLIVSRVLEALDRVPRGQPVRLTVVFGPQVRRQEIDFVLLGHPLWRVEERAPQIFDVELPNTKFDELMESYKLLRKVDLGGRIYGVKVPSPDDRAILRIALELPLLGSQRRDLQLNGMKITREGEGDVSGEALGKTLAYFVSADWLGPVEVRRVAVADR